MGGRQGRIEQKRELFNLTAMKNIQFYRAKFIKLLTNIMGKVYNITNRAENTHSYILVCFVIVVGLISDVSDDYSKFNLI